MELRTILLSSPNPRSVFSDVFTTETNRNKNTEGLVAAECRACCKFKTKLEKIAFATFNIKAKKFASTYNDEIRASKKRTKGNSKKSSDARKLKKLSSSWILGCKVQTSFMTTPILPHNVSWTPKYIIHGHMQAYISSTVRAFDVRSFAKIVGNLLENVPEKIPGN